MAGLSEPVASLILRGVVEVFIPESRAVPVAVKPKIMALPFYGQTTSVKVRFVLLHELDAVLPHSGERFRVDILQPVVPVKGFPACFVGVIR